MQNRAILTSMRAAAMVVVATGLNEVIAGAEPRYEPLYVYLGAVAIIVWLDGMLLGGLTAVGCTILYTLLFGSIPPLVPLFAMLVVVVVAGLVRALVRSRMRRAPPEIYASTMPLLPPPIENTEVLAAIDELRAEMRAAVTAPPPNLAETQRLSGALADAQSALADTQSALADAQSALTEERRRVTAAVAEASLLRLEADHAAREGAVASKRIAELEEALANVPETAGTDDEAGRLRLDLEALQRDAAAMRERHDSEMRAERARTIAARAESSARVARFAELEAELVEAKAARELAELERDRAMATQARVAELEAALAGANAARDRADAQRGRAEAAGIRVSTRADASQKEAAALAARVAELERALAEAVAARDRAEAEARSESVRAEAARGETEALQATLDRERESFDSKLNTIVAHLASDHESDIGQAVSEREEARAEARMLGARVASLQSKLLELETPPPPPPALAAAPHAPGPRVPGRARILVAHPDADLRANAQASLSRDGYDVFTAADGLEALRLANTHTPEVVIADAVMPKMNGRELCQLLKSQEKTAHIRVVLLLRTTDPAPKGELVPDEVLRKPVPLETLRSTLAALLTSQPP